MKIDDELASIYRAEVAEQIELLREGLRGAPAGWDVGLFFRASHNIKGAARMVDAAEVQEAAHSLEDLFSDLRDGGERTEGVVEQVRAECRRLSTVFDGPAPDPGEAPAEEAPQSGTLRVAIDKLDKLFEHSAALAAFGYRIDEHRQAATRLHSALEAATAQAGGAALKDALAEAHQIKRGLARDRAQFELLATQLQDAVRALRMVRFDNLRGPLSKALHEAVELTGLPAELRFDGASTEIDRKTLEGLSDPLVHLIRNAVAHGAEPADERSQAGKFPMCQVQVTAQSYGPWVEVSVADDGRGMSPGKIRERAVAEGLISAEKAAAATPAQILDLAFLPGFSTADAVNELVGRGVGLDVVRENVAALGGHIHLESTPGKGTAFHLRVPLTRLTTKCIVVRVGRNFAAIPIGSVLRTLRSSISGIGQIDGKNVLSVHGGHVPIERLGRLLALKADDLPEQPAVIIADQSDTCAVFVDEVLGERELVIQRPGWNLKRVPGLTGATVIDSGRLCLILDAAQLCRRVNRVHQAAWTADGETGRKRHRILLADDSLTSRTLEYNILTAAGYEVTLANDGEEAWQKMQAGDFELLLSDVEMPLLNGFELTRRVRADDRFLTLPVVLVTSLGNDEHKEAGAEAGANAYIVKGVFDQDLLLKAVKRLL